MHGTWGGAVRDFATVDDTSTITSPSTSEDEAEDEVTLAVDLELEGEEGEDEIEGGEEERGRKREKGVGSVKRMEHPGPGDLPGSPKVLPNSAGIQSGGDVKEGGGEVGGNPFMDQALDKEEKELDKIVKQLELRADDGELLRIDLDDVQEGNEDEDEEIPIDPKEKQE